MGGTDGQNKEVVGGRCLLRSGPRRWIPTFSLLAQPNLQVVEGMKGHGGASSKAGVACAGFSFSGDLQTPVVDNPHLSSPLDSILEEAASPGGFRKVPRAQRDESLTRVLVCFLLQDYIFYLEPDKLESGKGKCSYDPKVDTVSALISESCNSLGPALLALGGGNRQAGQDSCSCCLPVLPHIPREPASATPACSSCGCPGHLECPVLGHLSRWGSQLQTSASLSNSGMATGSGLLVWLPARMGG